MNKYTSKLIALADELDPKYQDEGPMFGEEEIEPTENEPPGREGSGLGTIYYPEPLAKDVDKAIRTLSSALTYAKAIHENGLNTGQVSDLSLLEAIVSAYKAYRGYS